MDSDATDDFNFDELVTFTSDRAVTLTDAVIEAKAKRARERSAAARAAHFEAGIGATFGVKEARKAAAAEAAAKA